MERSERRYKLLVRLMFIIYLAALSYFLFFSERYGRTNSTDEYRYNLVLFDEIKRFIKYRNVVGIESFIVNILGNVLAFTPFGMLVPMLGVKQRKLFFVLLLCLEFTITIELIQLVSKSGVFDVDDILMNTAGGILGYMFYAIMDFVVRRSRKHGQKKEDEL